MNTSMLLKIPHLFFHHTFILNTEISLVLTQFIIQYITLSINNTLGNGNTTNCYMRINYVHTVLVEFMSKNLEAVKIFHKIKTFSIIKQIVPVWEGKS